MTAKSKLIHLEGKEQAVLGALAKFRTRTLKGTQGGKAPRWLATLLFQDLETAIKADGQPPAARSRFELTESWCNKLAGPSPPSDDSNDRWNLAYKNVDDAIRTVAERIAKASDSEVAPQNDTSSGFAIGSTEFLFGKVPWTLRIAGPLHGLSSDDHGENIRLLPEIADQRKVIQPRRKSLPRRVGLAMGDRISPFARTLATLGFLIFAAGCITAFIISGRRISSATTAKLDVVSTGDVHLRYRGIQSAGTSPVCGCDVEVDPNKWWGISALARDVSMFRSGGPLYTKYVVTGPGPSDGVDWLPGMFKTTARIFILRQPFGGEGFNPRLLSSGKMPGGYEIVTAEEVEEAFISFITKGPLHVHLPGNVPVFAMLPIENSEITVHRSVGMYASAASRVIFTENYRPWKIPSSGELVDDGRYEFPIADFVGPDVVFWSEHPADVVTEHKVYHYPLDGGNYIIGIFVTKPPFASRVGVMPLTVGQRDEDVTTLGTRTKTPIITEPGMFQIEIPNPIDQMHDYSQIYEYVRAHPNLSVDSIPLISHTIQAINGPPNALTQELPEDYKFKNEFGYPPIPPMAGFNVFGPLLSIKADSARGSVFAESDGSVAHVNDGSTVELRNISQINRDRGILKLPFDSKDTVQVSLRATGDVFVNGKATALSNGWIHWMSGTRTAYLAGAMVSLLFASVLGLRPT